MRWRKRPRKSEQYRAEVRARLIAIEANTTIIAKALAEMAARVASTDEMDRIIACAESLGTRLDTVTGELTRINPPELTLTGAISALKTKLSGGN